MAPGGVNDCLAAALGLRSVRPLALYKQTPWYQVTVFAPEGLWRRRPAGDGPPPARGAWALTTASPLPPRDRPSRPTPLRSRFLGASGKEAVVAEERIEALCAPASLQAVLSAMRQAHPYEEPAFSVTRNHAVHTDFPRRSSASWKPRFPRAPLPGTSSAPSAARA